MAPDGSNDATQAYSAAPLLVVNTQTTSSATANFFAVSGGALEANVSSPKTRSRVNFTWRQVATHLAPAR